MANDSETSTNAICVHGGVVLKKGSSLKYVKARPGRKERMLNFSFYLDKLIGKPYGYTYEVQGNQISQVDARDFERDDPSGDGAEETRDNRDIIDRSDSQKLSKDDIMRLKEEGTDRNEIIERIVESSSTFKEKTSYSQAKYLKKKKKKHLAYFTTYKPTARLLSELYFTRASSKILEIRPDSLAQILTWSNVQYGSKVLVAETCQGLLIGSVLERLGEEGKIVQAYNGNFPVRIILDQFNITEERKTRMICGFSLENIEEVKKELFENQTFVQCKDGEDTVQEQSSLQRNEAVEEEKIDNFVDKDDSLVKERNIKKENCKDDESEDEKSMEVDKPAKDEGFAQDEHVPCNKFYTKEKRLTEENEAKHFLKMKNLDAIIIATKYHPLALLLELIEFIKPSASIVVYCQYKEPLMECYRYLRDASLALNVNLTETWFRELQVLPNRTHPGITMSARSGYLLRALKINNLDSESDDNWEPKQKASKH